MGSWIGMKVLKVWSFNETWGTVLLFYFWLRGRIELSCIEPLSLDLRLWLEMNLIHCLRLKLLSINLEVLIKLGIVLVRLIRMVILIRLVTLIVKWDLVRICLILGVWILTIRKRLIERRLIELVDLMLMVNGCLRIVLSLWLVSISKIIRNLNFNVVYWNILLLSLRLI